MFVIFNKDWSPFFGVALGKDLRWVLFPNGWPPDDYAITSEPYFARINRCAMRTSRQAVHRIIFTNDHASDLMIAAAPKKWDSCHKGEMAEQGAVNKTPR